jgi:pimeloyl-ACP methyl ester carboxylesterase
MVKAVEFKNNFGLTLRGYVHEPKKYDTAVIHLHGFPGSMARTARRMCTALSARGYLCLRFDFSGSATSDGKFEDKLMSREVTDIRYAVNFLAKNYRFKKLILIGHSTGAIDAALYSSRDKRINKLVLMGGVSKLDEAVRYDVSDRQMKDFWEKGYVVYNRPGYWYHRKKIKKAFYDEFFKLNIPASLKKFRKPVLIVHGTKDEVIPAGKDPRELYEICRRPKKLVLIAGADHSFTRPKYWRKLITAIDKFIKSHR